MISEIDRIASGGAGVHGKAQILTMHFGPEEILVAVSLKVRAGSAITVLGEIGEEIRAMLESRFGLRAQVYVRTL